MMRSILLATTALLLSTFSARAQCKLFTKNKCMPSLAPYLSNGQYNGATLFEGETATVMMMFYPGQDYRLIVCVEKILGNVSYLVKDEEGEVLYDSQKAGSLIWDFKVDANKQLLIEVSAPSQTSDANIKVSGCVSTLVGFLD